MMDGVRKSIIASLAVLMAAAPALAVDELSLNVTTATTVSPGDTVTVTLNVGALSTAINGTQALLQYDQTILSLQSVVATDLGLIAPAEGWIELLFSDVGGDITYASVINGASTSLDGIVATLTFAVIGEGTTVVAFRADNDPFFTKLTSASDNQTIFPNKVNAQAITSTCDDGVFCNGQETLVGGTCQAGTPPDCSGFSDQCNDAVCNETLASCEAQPINEGLSCNDGAACTTGDVCTIGACSGVAVDCSGLTNTCNLGTCNATTGVCEPIPTNEGGNCDDGLFCTGTESCSSGTCVSTGNPCAPLQCDEQTLNCVAPIHVADLEVFYAGHFADAEDPSKAFLATGGTATSQNITNYTNGITGVRMVFNTLATFATNPADAFLLEWSTGTGTTFSPIDSQATMVAVTAVDLGGITTVEIVITDRHVRRRWLKVTLLAAQVTSTGLQLDGEMVGNPVVLPSGDGSPGGNAIFYLGNLTGDVTGDRRTLLEDIGLIRLVVNPFLPVPITDLNDIDKDAKVLLGDVGDARLDVNPFVTLPIINP